MAVVSHSLLPISSKPPLMDLINAGPLETMIPSNTLMLYQTIYGGLSSADTDLSCSRLPDFLERFRKRDKTK